MTAKLTNRPIRFVFVNRYYEPDESASSQMLTDLARGLAASGLMVHVVCSRQLYGDPKARLPRHENLLGVTVHRVPTTRFGRTRLFGRAIDYASFYAAAGVTLAKLLGIGDVLIAKTDPPLVSILAALIARSKRAALINWQQDVFPEVAVLLGVHLLPGWLDALLRRLRDSSLRFASMNVVIGSRMFEYFRGRGIPADRLCVIENWADSGAIVPKPSTASALRARLELADRFVVCYSGNLGKAHEFDTLLSAASALRANPSIVFLIIGGGTKMAPLQRAVAALSLENFRFLPYQPREELEDSLAAADLHVVSLLPTLEGLILPSKLYGILAAGRPLVFIGDPKGDIARVVSDAECGAIVEINAGEALAAAILRLQADPAACDAMGTRARESLVNRYSMEKGIERWLALLDAKPQSRGGAVQPPSLSGQ